MSPNEAVVAIVALVGVLGAPLAALHMWLRRPAARNKLPGRSELAALEARLERIEVAVQSIALETERISEGQRFTSRLLSGADRTRDGRSGATGI